jgi:hypothetical protein
VAAAPTTSSTAAQRALAARPLRTVMRLRGGAWLDVRCLAELSMTGRRSCHARGCDGTSSGTRGNSNLGARELVARSGCWVSRSSSRMLQTGDDLRCWGWACVAIDTNRSPTRAAPSRRHPARLIATLPGPDGAPGRPPGPIPAAGPLHLTRLSAGRPLFWGGHDRRKHQARSTAGALAAGGSISNSG